MTSERETKLALALTAALRWPYQTSMWDHIATHVPEGQNYDPSYIADINMIRAGIDAARQIGIVPTEAGPLSR